MERYKFIKSLLFTLFISCSVNATQSIEVTKIKNVYDGDTFRAYLVGEKKDQKIRVRNVDTPEIKGQCQAEKIAAIKARDFVKKRLTSAKKITLTNLGIDIYNRTLADVSIDGVDLATLLIKKGLGRKWRGKREEWCY